MFKKLCLAGFLWGIIGLSALSAQTELNRISITERSDGNGYVIRYHLSQMVNSYDLIQPEINRIQMQIFGPGLDTAGVIRPELNEEITDLKLIPLNGGVGIDITTSDDAHFQTEAYPDQNLRDLLLNVEYTTRNEAEEAASQSELFDWTAPEIATDVTTDPETTESPDEEMDEDVEQIRARRSARLSFGIAGGIGFAHKLGGSYSAEMRQELIMGLTATINLPYEILSLDTAIETGLFYTQKGFLNPSSGIDAQTVVLDYIEVPVLGKFIYDLNNSSKPYLLGGFYTGFRTAAETIEEDGDREDLNDVTNSVDFGVIGGIGFDYILETATITTQARLGVGIPPIFNSEFSGSERPVYLSLLVGFRF